MPSAASYAVVFAVALGTTFALTPLFRRLAVRVNLLARPDERRVHTVPVPYLGGLAMLVGFLAALAVAWRMPAFETMFDGSSIPLGIALGAVVLCGVGTLDDIREVSAPAKTAGSVLGGSIMYLFGVSLLYFRIPFAETLLVLGPDLAPLVSVLWVLGMVNAVNFIDGLDGLAAGIVAIAAGSFFLYGHRLALPSIGVIGPDNSSPLIAIITAGLCLGFLPYNFNPARIFMGDGGALMLGGLMAASTMLVGGQTSEQFSGQVFFFFAPLFIPFFVMGVPIIDTAFAIVRRATKRTSVGEARQGPPPSPAHAPRPRSAAQRDHHVDVVGPAVGVRPVPRVHPQGRRHRAVRSGGPGARALDLVPPRHPPRPRRARPQRCARGGSGRRVREQRASPSRFSEAARGPTDRSTGGGTEGPGPLERGRHRTNDVARSASCPSRALPHRL